MIGRFRSALIRALGGVELEEEETLEDRRRRERLELACEQLEQVTGADRDELRILALHVVCAWTDPTVGNEQWQQLVEQLADHLVRTVA